MDKTWLPNWAIKTYDEMNANGTLTEQERALFTDQNLREFWEEADRWVSQYTGPNDSLGEWLIGSIITPLQLHRETGTKDQPSKKTKMRERQKEADILLDEAADLASDLARKLLELEKTTRLRPHPLDNYLNAIRDLETELREYPKTDDLFSDIPGMESQKSSWRDWLRAVNSNLQDMQRVCPGDFQMREKYWISLVHALIDKSVSRGSVQSALRNSTSN